MSDFPALEVLTSGVHGRPVGARVPLTRLPFVIGRTRDNPLSVPLGLVSRRHCELVREDGRWLLRDLGTSNGTFHLGARVRVTELQHADVFELAGRAAFRLLLQEPVDLRDAAMEQAIIEAPDDAQRWSVYADWLQERGAPLGLRLANPLPADDARWLGPLAVQVARGELEVTWAHGLPRRVVFRHFSGREAIDSWFPQLELLMREPETRFLRELDLGFGAFRRQEATGPWATRLLELLGLDAFPMLERLQIGPGTRPPDLDQLDPMLEARRRRYPRFVTTSATLCVPWRTATLTHEGKVFTLPRHASFHVGPRGSDLELGGPAFGVMWLEDRWRLTVDSAAKEELKVNGVSRSGVLLRPGDVIEPLAGVRLLFDA